MALTSNPRTSALLAILLAGVVAYIGYTGEVLKLVGLNGLQGREARAEAMADTISTLQASIDSAKRELSKGTVEDVRRRVEQYRAMLSVLREFVPDQTEVPNLLDDISNRAKVRGVNLADFLPQAVVQGPEPFDTYGYDFKVIGRYDQIGVFLSDVASLRRIFVPTEVNLTAADRTKARALGDTTTAMLEASFKVRTYVKAAGGLDGM